MDRFVDAFTRDESHGAGPEVCRMYALENVEIGHAELYGTRQPQIQVEQTRHQQHDLNIQNLPYVTTHSRHKQVIARENQRRAAQDACHSQSPPHSDDLHAHNLHVLQTTESGLTELTQSRQTLEGAAESGSAGEQRPTRAWTVQQAAGRVMIRQIICRHRKAKC